LKGRERCGSTCVLAPVSASARSRADRDIDYDQIVHCEGLPGRIPVVQLPYVSRRILDLVNLEANRGAPNVSDVECNVRVRLEIGRFHEDSFILSVAYDERTGAKARGKRVPKEYASAH